MTIEEVNAIKARWFDLVQQIAAHQRAIAKLQEQTSELERQIPPMTTDG